MEKHVALLVIVLAVVAALPHQPVIRKLDPGLRYQYAQDSAGQLHLVDLWETVGDVAEAARYNPDTENVYHLFTRRNPSLSQVLVFGNADLVQSSNFNPSHRTAILIHGWGSRPNDNFNAVVSSALLAAEDMNVISVGWCAGACTINYLAAIRNAITSGAGVARFITWLNSVTGADPSRYYLAGHSLGGQQVGVVGRNLGGELDYIIGLDPAGPGWENHEQRFNPADGKYTEVIHTNVGGLGFLEPLALVDFYPNGGTSMPGCLTGLCDHDRCYHYLAESILTGGLTGRRCENLQAARSGNCTLDETLPLGGLKPKFGAQGIYYVPTNASPPFSQG